MNTSLLMQLFILVNAVVLGAVLVLVIQYGRAHFGNRKKPVAVPVEQPVPVGLDPSVKQRMLKQAEQGFQQVLNKSVASLEEDLASTTDQLRSRLAQFGHDAAGEEAEQYHKTISELHDEAKNILGATQAAITTHQTEITDKLTSRQNELETELVDKINGLEQELVTRQAELQNELNERQAELEAQLAKHHAELRTGFDERQRKIEAELTRHQDELEIALKERETSLAKLQTEIDNDLFSRRQQLETQLAEELAKKRAFLASQLETKLSDAVSSFLLEAMQHNIDLGAQAPYLSAMLEEHKAELVEGVARND